MSDSPPSYQFSFSRWLKAQVALLPVLTLVIGGAFSLVLMYADGRYMVQETDGEKLKAQIATVQNAVNEIRTEQRVSKGELGAVRESLQEVKEETREVNRKLDRLIERSLP